MIRITNRHEEQQIEIEIEPMTDDAEGYSITIFRDEDGSVKVRVLDHEDDSEERITLGTNDWTTKV